MRAPSSFHAPGKEMMRVLTQVIAKERRRPRRAAHERSGRIVWHVGLLDPGGLGGGGAGADETMGAAVEATGASVAT
ncbi:MAG TPA: hypothetical protein VGH28_01920 [Polyangiaceae bacterium]